MERDLELLAWKTTAAIMAAAFLLTVLALGIERREAKTIADVVTAMEAQTAAVEALQQAVVIDLAGDR